MGQMGFAESNIAIFAKKQLDAAERTNALLAELLVEAKHANELTRWQIDQQKSGAGV